MVVEPWGICTTRCLAVGYAWFLKVNLTHWEMMWCETDIYIFIAICTSVFCLGRGVGCRFTGPTPCWQNVLASTSVDIRLHKTCCVLCVLSLMDVLVQCVVFTVVDPSLLLFLFTTCLLQWWQTALSSVPTHRLERPWAELDSDRGQVPVSQSFLFCGSPSVC